MARQPVGLDVRLTSKTGDLFTTFSRELLAFVLPSRCAGCGFFMPQSATRRFCSTCLGKLERVSEPFCHACGLPLTSVSSLTLCTRCAKTPPSFGKARALFCYRASSDGQPDILGSVIRRHKYGPNQGLSAVLAELLEDGIPVDPGYDVVIPVPLHRRRLLRRGFNQSALLAAAVTRKLQCRLDVTTLIRLVATPPQTAQDLESRRRNVHNAFAVRYPERIEGLNVLLVDDVLTTGATANACAVALRAAGASTVDVLTIARAL
jgi:ComF family protein